MDWRKVWELPLENDGWGYAWANNGTMALTADIEEEDDLKLMAEVVDAINGVKSFTREGKWTAKGCDLYCDGVLKIDVRGWGELTSPNCLGLSQKEAAETQDDFIDYILSKLNHE